MSGNNADVWKSDSVWILIIIMFILLIFGLKYYFKYAA
jgi:hypothetical protein